MTEKDRSQEEERRHRELVAATLASSMRYVGDGEPSFAQHAQDIVFLYSLICRKLEEDRVLNESIDRRDGRMPLRPGPA